MLRRHEIDLIAGLVEGSLEDESEARALIARSNEALAEYKAQKVGYEALRSVEPVSLTETEKAALHRDLWTALQQAPQRAARKTPWYIRLAPVAAALFVIVGLGAVLTQGVLTQLSGNEAATVDTFAGASDGRSAETTQADSGGTEEAPDTTVAMGEDADDGAADLADEEAAQMAPALATAFAQIADAVRTPSDVSEIVGFQAFEASEELEGMEQCLERAGLPDYSIFGELEDPSEGEATYLVAVPSDGEIGPATQVAFIETGSCEIAHVEG